MCMTSTDSQDLPQGSEKQAAVQSMFDKIAPRYDLVNRLMTFRMDVGWRRKAIAALQLEGPAKILDLACGTGDFCSELTKAGHQPLGVDLSFGMLDAAQLQTSLVQGDLLRLPIADQSADGAVCGFALRNLVDLPPFFAELHRVVKPGGRIALLDVSQPDNRFLKVGHQFYFNKVVPKIGAMLSDKDAYSYLPKSVSYLPEPETMKQMLVDANLIDVDRKQLTMGISQLLTAARP